MLFQIRSTPLLHRSKCNACLAEAGQKQQQHILRSCRGRGGNSIFIESNHSNPGNQWPFLQQRLGDIGGALLSSNQALGGLGVLCNRFVIQLQNQKRKGNNFYTLNQNQNANSDRQLPCLTNTGALHPSKRFIDHCSFKKRDFLLQRGTPWFASWETDPLEHCEPG